MCAGATLSACPTVLSDIHGLSDMDEFRDIEIDPKHPRLERLTRIAVRVAFVVAVLAGGAAAVWFFGYSDFGPRWAGKPQVYAPKAYSHPSVELSLSDVAMVIERDGKARLKAYVKRSSGTAEVDLSTVRVRWTSECPPVVSVDSMGNISAHNPGSAFIKAVVENRDITANVATCLVTVRDKASIAEPVNTEDGIEVFDGAGVYDEKRRLIVFRDVKKFVVKGSRNHSITMRPGDRIYDVRIRGGKLVSGKFVKGSNSNTIKGLDEPL